MQANADDTRVLISLASGARRATPSRPQPAEDDLEWDNDLGNSMASLAVPMDEVPLAHLHYDRRSMRPPHPIPRPLTVTA